jgi:hypothetical protein
MNTLLEVNPQLVKQWHPNKNDPLTPKDVSPGSKKKFGESAPKATNRKPWSATGTGAEDVPSVPCARHLRARKTQGFTL